MAVFFTQRSKVSFEKQYKMLPGLEKVMQKKDLVKVSEVIAKAKAPLIKSDGRDADLPDTEDKFYLKREKLILQIEILMLKGVTSDKNISIMLGVTDKTVTKYKEIIEYRWAAKGRHQNLALIRGRARQRLNLITEELWTLFANAKKSTLKVQVLQTLLTTHDRQMLLDGLTPKIIEGLKDELLDTLTAGKNPQKLIEGHQEMLDLGNALAVYLQKNNTNSEADIINIEAAGV